MLTRSSARGFAGAYCPYLLSVCSSACYVPLKGCCGIDIVHRQGYIHVGRAFVVHNNVRDCGEYLGTVAIKQAHTASTLVALCALRLEPSTWCVPVFGLTTWCCPATGVKEGWQGRLTVRTLLGQDCDGVCHVADLPLQLARVARRLVCKHTQRCCAASSTYR